MKINLKEQKSIITETEGLFAVDFIINFCMKTPSSYSSSLPSTRR